MKRINNNRRGEKGSTLLNMMCFLIIVVDLMIPILDLANNHRTIAVEQCTVEQAMYVAEGGCEVASRWVESNIAMLATTSLTTTNGSGTIGPGTYNYIITKLNQTTFSVASTGTVNNVQRCVQIRWLYQPTYASFAFWAATNGSVQFVVGNSFYGHVHTDDPPDFGSTGSGTNNGAAFYAQMDTLTNQFAGSTNGAYFADGFQENTYQGTMADVNFTNGATSMKQLASNSSVGLVLQGATTLTFNGSSISIINYRMGWTNSATAHSFNITNDALLYIATAPAGSLPANSATGFTYITGGTLTGRVTIVSENDINLEGSITYVDNPTVVTNSIDALGLISGGDIWIATNAPNNITIDAAMMATGLNPGLNPTPTNFLSAGSFGVTDYGNTSVGSRGLLTLYGGIVQEVRGAVGTVNGSTVLSGYNKNYSYDPRFVSTPPPYYPGVGGKFQYSGWAEGH
jgi:hypothetical protein